MPADMEIKSGMVVESPLFPEPVKVEKVERLGQYIRIVGATIRSNAYINRVLTRDELETLKVFSYVTDFSASPENVFLALEAYRFRLASLFDPILAMNVSRVDPLPHQIEAVYGYILRLPRIRFMIADDPGAGKTIMAGLVIKELKLRGLARRILIVVPGHLKDQWLREMKERFSENFIVVDRHAMSARFGENVWERESQVITSIDFAKRDEILSTLSNVSWDLVIVDEAHKMAAYRYGDKISKTARYRLGEVLSRNTEHLLFLTATPHKGDPENFRLLLDLLEPGFFADQKMLMESIMRKENPLFIRRLKEDLRDFEGRPLFLPRHVSTVKFKLTDEEKALYNELSRYVITQYDKARRSDKKRNVAFALIILQRRMASSVYALKRSLERRKKRLEDLLMGGKEAEVREIDFEELEDYEEKERWRIEQEWEALSVAETRDELEREIKTIEGLIEMADKIIREEREVKLSELKRLMNSEEFRGQKVIIFTESRDTLEYLVRKIRGWGYTVSYIHGGMRLENRIRAEKEFKHETQVMVATEAAGEGINLQFCNLMINYDIPWNPNRLEQRMGRIHRYGQTREVYVFNLVNDETREGRVLTRLLEKLEEIRGALGDKVFDVIGEIFPGRDFYQLVVEAAANARSVDEILASIEAKLDEEYIARVKDALGESLATRVIDYTRIREMAQEAREYRLIPEYTEAFFVKAFQRAGGRVHKVGNYYRIDSIPYEIRRIASEDSFKNTWGILASRYKKVTFDKDMAMRDSDAEFVSFGHPLFEAVLEWTLRNYLGDSRRGAVFRDPSGGYSGAVFFYEGEVRDGKGSVAGKRLFAIYRDDRTGQIREVNPSIIWDLAPHEGESSLDEEWLREAEEYAVEALMRFKEELLRERLRQAEIKERYGVKSLEKLIRRYDAKLIEYEERRRRGEKMDLAIQMAERRKRDYERALEELREEIEKEKMLSVGMPNLVGLIRVIPGEEMVSDEEIERIGMEVAMEYERKMGREPEDVSAMNLGYDIRSKGEGEVRYIEVKARAGSGDVALTPNEWFKAKRFGRDYWLYVVEDAATNPRLYIIRDPAGNLKVVEVVESVRFVVPQEEWRSKGSPVRAAGFDRGGR